MIDIIPQLLRSSPWNGTVPSQQQRTRWTKQRRSGYGLKWCLWWGDTARIYYLRTFANLEPGSVKIYCSLRPSKCLDTLVPRSSQMVKDFLEPVFFSKAKVGMKLRAFARQVCFPIEINFHSEWADWTTQQPPMCNQGIQYQMDNPEPCSPWQKSAENLIRIIKGKCKRRTVCRRIPKNCWSFGLRWEAEIYSSTSYKSGTTGMERINGDTIDIS